LATAGLNRAVPRLSDGLLHRLSRRHGVPLRG
jgi:hypothetical protein